MYEDFRDSMRVLGILGDSQDSAGFLGFGEDSRDSRDSMRILGDSWDSTRILGILGIP